MSEVEFIKQIAPKCQEIYAKNNIFPSVFIGQAILESGWGKSELATKANNIFGIKALRNWNGEVYTVKTKEYTSPTTYKIIEQPFRKYEDWSHCIEDYSRFLEKEWYIQAGVFTAKTNIEQLEAIFKAGYTSDYNYIQKIKDLIQKYNLEQYDIKRSGGMKIAVRGGHNFKALGASGLISETHEDRKVKDSLIYYLKQMGHTVLDVTPGNVDRNTDLNYGVSTANNWGADLFISIHFNNAYTSYNGALGTETWTNLNNQTGKTIAKRITDNIASLGFKNRGVKDGINVKHLWEIRKTRMAAIIVEVCFVEATTDVSIYKNVGVDAIARKIAEGIANKTVVTSNTTHGNSSSIDGKMAVCTGNGVRVRSSIDTSSTANVIGKLNKGDRIKLFKDCGNGWYHTYYGEHGGYVSSKYLRVH